VIYGLYLSAAGALAEESRHAVISNNIANVSTPGFKADLAVFRERDPESVEGGFAGYATPMDALGGGLFVGDTLTRHAQGSVEVTEGEFDLAVTGKGYFPVTDGERTSYTRAGAFTRDKEGRLVMPDGEHFLADASGKAVQLPLDAKVSIAPDGTVSVGGEAVGTIELVGFENESNLVKVGDNLYDASYAETRAASGTIRQGALEMATVSPAEEMANMILAMRGYQANMQMIKMQDQSLADLISVGRLNI
jgi:flagellar basal-body rod protein FlgG